MKFTNIGVVGAGTMGQGIAEMLAAKGLEVYIAESTPHQLEQAFQLIEISLNRQMEKWAITAAEKKMILSRLHQTEKLEALVIWLLKQLQKICSSKKTFLPSLIAYVLKILFWPVIRQL